MVDSVLINGPETAPLTLLFAHGAGASMGSSFMEDIALGLSERGWRTVRFNFPYMVKRLKTGRQCPPGRQERLIECFEQHVNQVLSESSPLVLAGKSMGGRMASLMADRFHTSGVVQGCVALGYPFHPIGKSDRLRTDHLLQLQCPMLIVQGERDAMGRRSLVERLDLSQQIQIRWAMDGDHSFKPRKVSGRTEAANRLFAIEAVDDFLTSLLGR